MACIRKEKAGSCGHFICPFPEQSGYVCVDMAHWNGKSYCEVGCGCVKECEHSWPDGTEEASKAELAFAEAYPVEE